MFAAHPLLLILLLGAAAFLAGTMDTLAGGGGLITIPLLLLAGLPPHVVLGTNKCQASLGSGTASYTLIKKSKWNWRSVALSLVLAFIAAALGSLVVLSIHHHVLRRFLPVPLVVVLFYLLKNPTAGLYPSSARHKKKLVYRVAATVFGFYDGFLGPGTGTFWAVSLVHYLGLDLRTATIHAKLFNFVSNIASLLVFACFGQINITLGVVMGFGQWLGARLGAHILLSRDIAVLRVILMLLCAVLLLVLIKQSWLS